MRRLTILAAVLAACGWNAPQAAVTASKAVAEALVAPGETATYSIVLVNDASGAQPDNPGNELVDVLPAELTLASASATSGTAVADIGANTVTWNGSIPSSGSLTLTIGATLSPAAIGGSSVSNQATVNFDGDHNGSNESSAASDDPATATAGDATALTVHALPPTATPFVFHLRGDQEVPPTPETARGGCLAWFDAGISQLTVNCVHDVPGTTMAHVHRGAPGVNGPVVFDLGAPVSPLIAVWNGMTPADVADLFAGNFYVNVHSAAWPGGAIRGQLLSRTVDTLGFALAGAQVVPPDPTASTGNCTADLDATATQLALACTHDLPTPQDAHLHDAPRGQNGPLVHTFASPASPFSGPVPLGVLQVASLAAGFLYVDVHGTAVDPGTLAIRGQIDAGPAPTVDLEITLSDTPDPLAPGATLTYTLTVNQHGPAAAADVVVSDVLPAGTTFVSLTAPAGWSTTTPAVGAAGNVEATIASLEPGASAQFTLTVGIDAGIADGTVLSNTANVASFTSDTDPANDSATVTTTIDAPEADLRTTANASPDPVAPGATLNYTLQVYNDGPAAAANATLAATLPAGTTFVSLSAPGGWSTTAPAVGSGGDIGAGIASLPPGGPHVFTLAVAIDAGLGDGTALALTATAHSDTADPDAANDSATATATVDMPPSADLVVTISDAPDPVAAGDTLTYSITVTNQGPDAAPQTILAVGLAAETGFLSLSAPAGWTATPPAVGSSGNVQIIAATLAAGASADFALQVTVAAATAHGSALTANASAVSDIVDPLAANDAASASTTVTALPVVSATKTFFGNGAPGTTVIYTIVLGNTGAAPQPDNPGDEFIDVLPVPLILLEASADIGTVTATPATNTVAWNGAITPDGATPTLRIVAEVSSDAAPGSLIVNQGTAWVDLDANGSNETPVPTDDPGTGTAGDGTAFVVPDNARATIPAGGAALRALLAALLAAAAWSALRRRPA